MRDLISLLPVFRASSRRALLTAGLSAAAMAAAAPVLAQRSPPGPAQVPVEELMKTDLPEIVIGKADAPVTIVEYASMTCGHCAAFHNQILPKLKEKYIDPGHARIVFRDFPLDNFAAAVAMLARCVGGEGPPAFISEMFKRQNEWATQRTSEATLAKLFELSRQAGFTQASFDTCLRDTKLLEQIEAGRKRASEKFGVNSTPTFFINGRRLVGGSMSDFEKAIDPLIKK